MSNRMRCSLIHVYIAAIALCITSLTPWANAQDKQDSSKKPGPKIGVVNVTKAFEKYKKKVEKENEIQEEWNKKQEHIDALEKDIATLREEIELFEKGGDERKKKEEELEKKLLERKVYRDQARANLVRRRLDSQRQLHEDIFAEIKKYAKKNGYDLILAEHDYDLKSQDPAELFIKVTTKSVLYYSDKVDITDKIVRSLNSKYSKEIEAE